MEDRTFTIRGKILEGVCVVLNIDPEYLDADDIERLLLDAMELSRDRAKKKADKLQEIIESQYIRYEPEKEDKQNE